MDKCPSVNLPCKLVLALTLLVISRPCGQGGLIHPTSAQNGFVPPLPWAKSNDFKLAGINLDKFVTPTNESFNLSFRTASQLAQINGVNIWLCQPITLKNGQACISSLDLTNSVEPILYPKTNLVHSTIQTSPKYRQLAAAIVQGVLAYEHAVKS